LPELLILWQLLSLKMLGHFSLNTSPVAGKFVVALAGSTAKS